MDQHTTQDQQQQKDFFSTLFAAEGAERAAEPHQQQAIYNAALSAASPSTMNIPNMPVNFDFLGGMMAMQGTPPVASPQGQYNPQLMLEQRLKLNQLQQLQLQNQILQQQLEFLNGQGGAANIDGATDRQKTHTHYLGLPTPMSSTELHAQRSPNPEYISPMTLSFVDNSQYRQDMHPQLPPPDMHLPAHHMSATSAHSAPANIVFNTNPPVRLPSPGEMDFDLSPLTSPWIEAYKPDPPRQGSSNKRTASPNDDEQARYTRQRPSPAILPTQGSKRSTRGTKSASSTPLMRSTRSGSRKNGTAGDAPADTPSPVDLSMPPPAPPMSQDFNASSSTVSNSATPTQSMTPVTPASIMNLGRLGINSNLAPPSQLQKADGKGKGTSRRESNAGSKKHIGTSLVSPSLKPILPAGNVLGPNALASSSMPSPLLRKTSHKAAEQKRRDSLKTTFDDLRMLLPPIPLPSEDGFPDEPILPGAMPPRGPPRGNVEGPNRGISKLQLLRCGNDYIRLLKGKIERRDSEMSTLRREIVRLRSLIGEDVWREGAEDIDLDRDMDLGEVGPWRRSASAYDGDEGDEDGGE